MTRSVQKARNKEVSRGAIVPHILLIEGGAWNLPFAATCDRVVYVGEDEVVLCFWEDCGNMATNQVFNHVRKQLRGCCLWEESDCRSKGQTHFGDLACCWCVSLCIDGTRIE